MIRLFDEAREFGGRDPIDTAVNAPPAPVIAASLGLLLRTRGALGLSPVVAPALLFVPLGALLGPWVFGDFSSNVLGHLDVVVTVALGTLGIFVGLALNLRGRADVRLLGVAATEAGVTVSVVAGAAALLLGAWQLPLDLPTSVVASMLAICASASAAGFAEHEPDPRLRVALRIADLDDVLPVAVGAAVLALLHVRDAGGVLLLTAATAALGLAIGVAGWLLFERARSDAERLVFVLGAVMLVSGCAAYLGLSPLLAGFVAGVFWTYAPGGADAVIRKELRTVQHPLVVLLLLAAGASFEPTPAAVWLAAPFVAFRLAGKLLGGWIASRLTPGLAPADLGALLVPPGLIGIAFALNFAQVAGAPAGPALLSAVVLGTLCSELLAFVVVPQRGDG